ncbi:MAG: hypothetical protein U0271_02585 [Polyangiaceae bacterium]
MIGPRFAVKAALAATAASALTITTSAQAEPYRLRADVFAQAPDPSGFVMLQAAAHDDASIFLVDAEALVWTGVQLDAAGDPEARGEAVIASVRMRDPEHGLALRFGRLLYSAGAIRPIHLDGAVFGWRAPSGTQAEVFAGIPVQPRWVGRSYDWVLGGRASQDIGGVANVGVSYWQERDEGAVAHSELGIEASATPLKFFAMTGTASVDTERAGLIGARFSALLFDGMNRLELFAYRRSPSLALPATSLFASLGSHYANEIGLTGFYRVAPRLDISATATVDALDEKPGATQMVRAELRFDDAGKGAIGLELRRASMPDTSWTGARSWLRLPLAAGLSANAEVEVAIPDESAGRGIAWPWFLTGLRYVPLKYLEAAAAFEISSSPAYELSVGGLVRLTAAWSAQ